MKICISVPGDEDPEGKTMEERIDSLEFAIEECEEFSELAKEEIGDNIIFGRMFIKSIERYLESHRIIEGIGLHLKCLESGSQESLEASKIVGEFFNKEQKLKEKIENNSRLVKQNDELKRRIVILIEHTFNEIDSKFPFLLISYFNS